jgi:hypothetical protein
MDEATLKRMIAEHEQALEQAKAQVFRLQGAIAALKAVREKQEAEECPVTQ